MITNLTYKIVSPLLDLIYPPFCSICDSKINIDESVVCDRCWSKIPVNFMNTIIRKKDKNRKTYYKYIVWSYSYADISRDIIHDFKYRDYICLAQKLSKTMAESLTNLNELNDVDYLVPVPLHIFRYMQRGYNQSLILANNISKLTGIKISTDIYRTKYTKPQSSIVDKFQKVSNVKNAFRVKKSNDFRNKKIILIDDIVTSGSTVNECAKMLMKAGAEEVYVLSAALTN